MSQNVMGRFAETNVKEGEITHFLSDLSDVLDGQDKSISALGERLSPAMRSQGPCAAPDGKCASSPLTAMGERLFSLVVHLRENNRRIEDFSARLGI